ncbi:MAG: phosphatidate cytidylyltransferase [Burkholderiales bacterium]
MLKTRILTAAILVPAVLAALFLLPPRAWGVAALVVMAIGACEWGRLVAPGTRWAAAVGGVLLVGLFLLYAPAAGFDRGWPGATLAWVCGIAGAFWLLVAPAWVIARWPTRGRPGMIALGIVVLVAAWMAVVELQARSPWLVLAAMAIVWIADTAAYFSGRAFGTRKLAPLVSPGKTWEGVYGAWVAVALYAFVLSFFARDAGFAAPVTPLAIGAWIVLALVLASVSVVGDLFESWLKRDAQVKDSGTLLPGHGGILDRIDALLAAMPLAALAAHTFLARP